MNRNPKCLLSLLNKLGLLTNLIPYYGDIDDWQPLYLQLCKATRQFWFENSFIFVRMDRQFYHIDEIENLIKEGKFNVFPKLNKDFILKLDIQNNNSNEKKFAKRVKSYKFPMIKKLTILFANGIGNEEGKDLNDFMKDGFPKGLSNIYLSCPSNYIKLDNIRTGLISLLPKIQNEIILANFTLTQDDIKLLFENSYNGKSISLYSCRIEGITQNLFFECDKSYKLQSIDFHNSLEENNPAKLNGENFPILMKKLSKTRIRASLTQIKLGGMLYPQDKVQALLSKHDFHVNVTFKN